MDNNQGSLNVASFFDQSVNTGAMSPEEANNILGGLDTMAQMGAFGVDVNDLNSDQVILLVGVVDESGSMSPLQQQVISHFNKLLAALRGAKAVDDILVSLWTFSYNSKIVFSWKKIEDVNNIDTNDYDPSGATALFQTTLNALTSVAAYADSLKRSGMRVRVVFFVLTDGGDTQGGTSPDTIRILAETLLKQEMYTLAYFGYGDVQAMMAQGQSFGFPVVKASGSLTDKELRAVFELVSGSVVQMSQNVAATNANSFFNQP